ncbi:MAG TPA: DUF3243 domain-containing protein [Desulfobacteria bacterium]|nr:DUF3243 domain-containing protein [Desulfobacteria bacterium]
MESSMNTVESFDKWQEFLGKGAQFMEKLGVSSDNVAGIAKGVGDFLASSIDPENSQQRVLKDLWDSANDNEKHTLASLVMRMCKNHSGQKH